jgi:hypothetical protein
LLFKDRVSHALGHGARAISFFGERGVRLRGHCPQNPHCRGWLQVAELLVAQHLHHLGQLLRAERLAEYLNAAEVLVDALVVVAGEEDERDLSTEQLRCDWVASCAVTEIDVEDRCVDLVALD